MRSSPHIHALFALALLATFPPCVLGQPAQTPATIDAPESEAAPEVTQPPSGEIKILANRSVVENEPLNVLAELTGDYRPETIETVKWWVVKKGETLSLDESDFEPHDEKRLAIFNRHPAAGTYTVFAVATHTSKHNVVAEPVTVVVGPLVAAPPVVAAAPVAEAGEQPAIENFAPKSEQELSDVQKRFRDALAKRVVDIRLPDLDVKFNSRRNEVATALESLTNDKNVTDLDDFNSKLGNKLGEIIGKDKLPEATYDAWRRLFRNDAPAIAAEVGIPTPKKDRAIGEVRKYYELIATVLESEAVSDEVTLKGVVEFLRKRGYTAVPSSSSGFQGSTFRHRWHRR